MLLPVLCQDRTAEDLDTSLRLPLESTTRLPEAPACDALLSMLKSKTPPTLLQRFTTEALAMLRDWQQSSMGLESLSPLPENVLDSLETARDSGDVENLIMEDSTTELDGNGDERINTSELAVRLGGTGLPPVQKVLGQMLLNNHPEPDFYDCFLRPTTGALLYPLCLILAVMCGTLRGPKSAVFYGRTNVARERPSINEERG
ncbi:hypothetical protein DL98DRAFT_581802 [Cadophora sp. DSE1049]|nr:hypothetical protein DL98DRAFT_581802 [Cadophora sp. DSE1049]